MKELLDLIKPFLAPKLVGWILKLLAGVFIAFGWQESQSSTFVSGLVDFILAAASFGIGLLISLVQNKKAVLTEPPK